MDLKSLLLVKLEYELIKDINEYFNDETLSELIMTKVKQKVKDNKISIDSYRKIIIKDNRCCARSMGPRYLDDRCPNSSSENIDYCKKHLNRIEEYGYLLFGRYDQPRPKINEKGNKIPWRDNSAMDDINTIIQYQQMNLIKLIK